MDGRLAFVIGSRWPFRLYFDCGAILVLGLNRVSVHGICHEFLTTHLGRFNVREASFVHSEAQGSWKPKNDSAIMSTRGSKI
jgi:hypothetical protein